MLHSKNLLLLACLCLLWSTPGWAKTFGAGLSLQQATPLSTILAEPERFVGKKLLVEGLILEVCERRGCWLFLAGDKPFEKIRVKVVDGQIVFPLEARGKQARVEGVLEKMVLSRDQLAQRLQHYAEERGEPFDPSSVREGETSYRLRGIGAEIEGL